jgi:hypothetical protein
MHRRSRCASPSCLRDPGEDLATDRLVRPRLAVAVVGAVLAAVELVVGRAGPERVDVAATVELVIATSGADGRGPFEVGVVADQAAFAPCTYPVIFKRLRFGKHSFMVESKDGAGTLDQTPSLFKFWFKRPST